MNCRWIRFLLCVVVCVMHGLYAVGEEAAADTTVIIVGEESPPFEFSGADGKPRGIVVDLWHLWAEKVGIEIDYRIMNWSDALAAVQDGKADIVAGMFRTPEREAIWDFSEPYYQYETAIWFHRDLGGISELTDLKGFRVGMMDGDASLDLLNRAVPSATPVTYPDWESLIRAGLQNDVRVLIADVPQARHYLAKINLQHDLMQCRTPLRVGKLHGGVKKGNADMVALMNRGFAQIAPAEVDAIRDHWAGVPSRVEVPWREIGFASVGGVLALLMIHVFLLRAQVGQQTRALKSSQQELLETSQLLEGMFDAIPDVIGVQTLDHTVIRYNRAGLDLLQIENECPRGRKCFQFIGHEDPCETCATSLAIETGQSQRVEKFIPELDRWFEIRAYPVFGEGGEMHRVIEHIRDITEQREAREKLREANETLEQKVRHRTQELIQSERMAAIGVLASGVAHEFNNINTAILGFADLARQDLPPDSPVAPLIERVCASAERAASITRNLLDFSGQRSRGKQEHDLSRIVTDTLALVGSRLKTSGIRLETDLEEALPVHVDGAQLGQVILNLLINAQHAMLGRESRTLSLAGVREGDEAVLRIADSGCGIPPDNLARIWEPFYSTKGEHAEEDGPQQSVKGTGLGLSVSRTIVDEHGGFLDVESRVGVGTTFILRLPLVQTSVEVEGMAAPAVAVGAGDVPPLSILVVDDESDVRDFVGICFDETPATLTEARFADEAVQLLETRSFDLVLLDLRMPGSSGLEVLERIQQTPALRKTRCVIMTGLQHHDEQELRAQPCVYGVLIKPFAAAELLAAVTSAAREPSLQ